jgi:Zn-dependent protease with chaperone function
MNTEFAITAHLMAALKKVKNLLKIPKIIFITLIEYNWRLYRFCSKNFIQPITKMVGGAFALVPQSVVVLSPALQLIYSHNTCLFIMWHEIGHIVNRHFNNLPWWKLLLIGFNRKRLISKGQVQKEEMEADEYAASKLGKEIVIEGLKEMYGWQLLHDKYKSTITTREFALRIAHLEDM